MRIVMISPGFTLPVVVSQPVPPPFVLVFEHSAGAACSMPVPASSAVEVHVEIVPAVPPPSTLSQPVAPFVHCVNRPVLPAARFTPTGYLLLPEAKNARFLSARLSGQQLYIEQDESKDETWCRVRLQS